MGCSTSVASLRARGGRSVPERNSTYNSAFRSSDSVRTAFLAGHPKVSEACPLDARQLYGLSKSWKAINRNMTITAINMFARLFETNEELKSMFAQIRDLETLSDLRSSKSFESHAMKVICTIDDVIVNMDDIDYVNRMLQLLARSHCRRIGNFNADLFWRIEEPFILAVKEELGDRFTISIETTYRTTIRYILSTMVEELRRPSPATLATPVDVQSKIRNDTGNTPFPSSPSHKTSPATPADVQSELRNETGNIPPSYNTSPSSANPTCDAGHVTNGTRT